MKIFDCFMFYDEDLLLDLRLNILDQHVDFFVIVESKYFHNGKERQLKFDIQKHQFSENPEFPEILGKLSFPRIFQEQNVP